ncbi:MAG: discoidin domain-containing protein, partial [Chloroflexota bacterium]|nr:discoidin domain-containing protein [Chloroflexota bacterium]
AWAIQVSPDGTSWTTLATRGNSASLAWQSLPVSTSARYVRFLYSNPGGDTTLGYLAEVEIWGTASVAAASVDEPAPSPTVAPTATQSASPTAEPVAPSATVAPVVVVTGSGVISGTDGEGARCRVAASTDAEILTVLPEGSTVELTGSLIGDWRPVLCGAKSGYVRGDFVTLPGQEPAPTEVLDIPTTVPTATPYAIVDSARSDNASTSLSLYDGDLTTTWGTETSTPPDVAFVWFDLGWAQPIESLRWRAGSDLMATSLVIELSEDGVEWARLSEVNLTVVQSEAWYEEPVDVTARFVRLSLPNPYGLPRLGGIAEVEIRPAISARPFAVIVTPEPLPTIPVIIEPVATEPVVMSVEGTPAA